MKKLYEALDVIFLYFKAFFLGISYWFCFTRKSRLRFCKRWIKPVCYDEDGQIDD
jgi:hypothetical protein